MDQERMTALAELLSEDTEWATELLQKDPEEAAKILADKGYDYTANEIKTFSDELVSVYKNNGELSESDMDGVVGGFRIGYIDFVVGL